jgi:hypothetical protein
MLGIYNTSRVLKKKNLEQSQIELINQMEYNEKNRMFWVGKVIHYIDNNFPLEILVTNQKKIQELGRDSSSLKSFLIRYGEDIGTKLHNEKTKASTITKSRMVDKLGEKGAEEFYKARGASLENYIARHGETKGRQVWDKYLAKRAKSYEEKHKSGHVFPKYNLEYYVKLYGEEQGKKVYFQKINSQRYKVSKSYYIDQFGPIMGPIYCRKNKDHNSLDYFKEKYGEENAEELYSANCLKISSSTAGNHNRYSKISKELFDKIKETITDLHYYGENEMTWATSGILKETQRAICPDLYYKGKIIEFNGDLFHANPLIFTGDDTPHPYNKKLTASEIWKHDARREEYYKSKDYSILVIWESEYKQKQQEIIDKCIQFLMN